MLKVIAFTAFLAINCALIFFAAQDIKYHWKIKQTEKIIYSIYDKVLRAECVSDNSKEKLVPVINSVASINLRYLNVAWKNLGFKFRVVFSVIYYFHALKAAEWLEGTYFRVGLYDLRLLLKDSDLLSNDIWDDILCCARNGASWLDNDVNGINNINQPGNEFGMLSMQMDAINTSPNTRQAFQMQCISG